MDPSSTYVCALTLSKKPCQNNSKILVGYIYIIGLQLKKPYQGLIRKNYEYGYWMQEEKNAFHNLLRFYVGLKHLNMSSVNRRWRGKFSFQLSHVPLMT